MAIYSQQTLKTVIEKQNNQQSNESIIGLSLGIAAAVTLTGTFISKLLKKKQNQYQQMEKKLNKCLLIARKTKDKDYQVKADIPDMRSMQQAIDFLSDLVDIYGNTLITRQFNGRKCSHIMRKYGFRMDYTFWDKFWAKCAKSSSSALTLIVQTGMTAASIAAVGLNAWFLALAIPWSAFASFDTVRCLRNLPTAFAAKVKETIKGLFFGKKLSQLGWNKQSYTMCCTKLINIILNLKRNNVRFMSMNFQNDEKRTNVHNRIITSGGSSEADFTGFLKFTNEFLVKNVEIINRIGTRL